jgi:citrate lyase synthetase
MDEGEKTFLKQLTNRRIISLSSSRATPTNTFPKYFKHEQTVAIACKPFVDASTYTKFLYEFILQRQEVKCIPKSFLGQSISQRDLW